MATRDPRPVLAALLAGLDIRSSAERAAHARLVSLIERSAAVDDSDALAAHSSATQRAGAPDAAGPGLATVSDDELPRSAEFRVFRREAPIVSPASALTVPAWARGAEIAETIGPLRGSDGRLFWFDFYRIVRLVPVYFAGDPQPAFLFHLHERRLRPGELIDIEQVVSFFRRNRYTLERGSIWIRADLLAAASPPASYVGLKVRGGSLVFSPQAAIQSGRITIPAGGSCSIHLDLEPPAVPAPGGGASGKDAADATLDLPGMCEIGLANGHATITRVGDARWALYGQPVQFAARQNPVPTWEPALLSVFVPFTVSEIRHHVARGGFSLCAAARTRTNRAWRLDAAGGHHQRGRSDRRGRHRWLGRAGARRADDWVARTTRGSDDAAIAVDRPGAWTNPDDRHGRGRRQSPATAAAVAGVEATRAIDRRSAICRPQPADLPGCRDGLRNRDGAGGCRSEARSSGGRPRHRAACSHPGFSRGLHLHGRGAVRVPL